LSIILKFIFTILNKKEGWDAPTHSAPLSLTSPYRITDTSIGSALSAATSTSWLVTLSASATSKRVQEIGGVRSNCATNVDGIVRI
jgi:hypothetical protein